MTTDELVRTCATAGPAPRGESRDWDVVAREWLEAYGAIALATVIKTWGSSPVPVGGHLVVAPGDRFEGSVSGGCVEAEVIAAAADVIATGERRVLEFGVEDEAAWRVGLPCGGRIEVLVDRLSGERDREFLDHVAKARANRKQLIVSGDITRGGRSIVESCDDLDLDTRRRLDAGDGVIIERENGRQFLQAIVPAVQVLIIGAGHIAQVLSDLGRCVGLAMTVIDPRTAFATADRFRDVKLVHEWPEQALRDIGLDARTAVVTLAHSPQLDDEALIAALHSQCFYVGALGSRRSHGKRLARLRSAGVGEAELARIDGPVGLPIGAQGPAEIAVSILAAIVKARRKP